MTVDFFEATEEAVRTLNQSERELFEHVVKNMDEVKNWSIQKFASEWLVSTTTIFRFTQKLGFSGYSDFINSLLVTCHNQPEPDLPEVITGGDYSEAYLKNAIESVRVMSAHRIEQVMAKLALRPDIYILTDDNTHPIGQYCERLFISLGFHAYFPEAAYQMQNLANYIRSQDMVIALSYSGEDAVLIDIIQRVFLRERPYLLSITRADNNRLESLSDTNFYIFSDEIHLNNMDLTSSVAMLMILELLIYEFITKTNQT
ncbi:MAG: MurR/RpiR family transcriptional regulator [Treponema sp.]|nr:MurR/RpiR family transcriptional regulator [Treponema sp.]